MTGHSHPSLAATAHRPWPLPHGRWTLRQSWYDLLFAHWPVPAEELRPFLPPDLTLQTFDGLAWLGLVPFRMVDVAPRPFPPVPPISNFPELNLRTYVENGGKPGVWFFSLDAHSRIAVAVGRSLYHLPYQLASIAMTPDESGFRFDSVRAGGNTAVFSATYRPTSAPFLAAPGTLEQFLTERYCLYAAAPSGALQRTDIHHVPWPLQAAEAEISANTVPAAAGLPLAGPPSLLHFSRGVDVAMWPTVLCS